MPPYCNVIQCITWTGSTSSFGTTTTSSTYPAHGVDAAEVEEVVFDGGTMTAQTYHPLRTLFVGATEAGRFLLVVVARIGENQGRVITARDASRKERDAYKRWREVE